MIDVRLQLNYPGFALEVDLHLPGRGVTRAVRPLGLRQDHTARLHRRVGARRRRFDPGQQ